MVSARPFSNGVGNSADSIIQYAHGGASAARAFS
jgi:hypothetical protein